MHWNMHRQAWGEMMINSIHKKNFLLPEIKLSNEQLAQLAGLHASKSRTALLTWWPLGSYCQCCDWERHSSTGFGLSPQFGGRMDKTENFFAEFMTDHAKGKLREVVNRKCGSVTELVADGLGIKIISARSVQPVRLPMPTLSFQTRLIRNNMLDIVVWAEQMHWQNSRWMDSIHRWYSTTSIVSPSMKTGVDLTSVKVQATLCWFQKNCNFLAK